MSESPSFGRHVWITADVAIRIERAKADAIKQEAVTRTPRIGGIVTAATPRSAGIGAGIRSSATPRRRGGGI
jgi:pre-mRNA-splicing factor ATP-dependent RNA helicase DHX38/PRP16